VISTSSTSRLLDGGRRSASLEPVKALPLSNHGRCLSPARLAVDGTIHLTTAYGVRGAFHHKLGSYWSSSLFGGMAGCAMRTAKPITARVLCEQPRSSRRANAATSTCNPTTRFGAWFCYPWTPVKNLTFSAETIWATSHGLHWTAVF